jgi:peptidoglycan/xylan/chitin deacetylase (PgdA/CDA1 family)
MLSLLAGAAALGAATYAGFQAFLPSSQLYGKTFCGTPGEGRRLALTFDDGPNGDQTLRLLEVLDRHQVKATFFLIGHWVAQQPDVVRRTIAAGHAIGNHTWSHPNLIFSSSSEVRNQIVRCEETLKGLGAQLEFNGKKLFRPPWGARRPQTLRIVRQMGYVPVLWSVTCYDWKKGVQAAGIEASAVRQIRGGDIILLHDGAPVAAGTDRMQSIIATDNLIARYKAKGFEFCMVPELMQERSAS